MSEPRRPDPADDTERDAWLSEALRHAPDAQAAPSPALSEAILRQARAATRGAATSGAPRGLLAAGWAWLVRPPVAASFASLVIAATVGLMGWDRPMDEALAPPPVAVTSPAPAATPERQVAAPPTADVVTPPTTDVQREKPAAREPQAGRAQSKTAPAEAPRARAGAAASPPVQEHAPVPVPVPVPAPAPAPTPTPAPTDNESTANLRDASRPPDSAMLSRSAKATAFAAQAPNAREPRPPALTALLDSVATHPERWTWQRTAASQPMNPALQRWLVLLDNAAASRWRSATEPAAPPAASVLRLYRDGTLSATLHLRDDAIWLAPASQAALPGPSITALKQALDEAAP